MKNRCYAITGAFLSCGMALLAAGLAACGNGRKREDPPDTPWNNGYYAIMETENGYYTNPSGEQCLRYYEKETGKQIMLCAKPECRHDGEESCTATYRHLQTVNTLLYDGAIYFLALGYEDDVLSYDLYRAAPDGSALDKVGTAYSAQNLTDSECVVGPFSPAGDPAPFIIHKGYAYIPFFLSYGWRIMGFEAGGIMKMDIRTGRTEQIYAMEGIHDAYPLKLFGCGDYVYFECFRSQAGDFVMKRYDMKNGLVEDIIFGRQNYKEMYEKWGIITPLTADAVSEDGIAYILGWTDKMRRGIITYDIESQEILEKCIPLEEKYAAASAVMLYEDWIIVCAEEELGVYSVDGEWLGGLAYDFPGSESGDSGYHFYHYSPELMFKISNDKIYAVCRNRSLSDYSDPDRAEYLVYACPIREIAENSGKWEPAYTVQGQGGSQMSPPGRRMFGTHGVFSFGW